MQKIPLFARPAGGASGGSSLRSFASRLLRPSLLALGFLATVPGGFADTFSRVFTSSPAYDTIFTEKMGAPVLNHSASAQAVVFNPAAEATSIALHDAAFKVDDELLSVELRPNVISSDQSFGLLTRVQANDLGILGLVNFDSTTKLRLRLFRDASTTTGAAGAPFFDATFDLVSGVSSGTQGGSTGTGNSLVAGAPINVLLHQEGSSSSKFRLTVTNAAGLIASTGDQPLTTSAYAQEGACGVRFYSKVAASNAMALTTFSANQAYGIAASSRVNGGGYLQNISASGSRYYTYIDTGGVYRSDDKGDTWRMIHGTMPKRGGNYDARSVDVDPRNPDIVLAAMSPDTTGTNGNYLYRSTDGGKTWSQPSLGSYARFYGNGPGRTDGTLIVRKPDALNTILVASHGTGVRRSTDNGVSWTAYTSGLANVFVGGLLVDARTANKVWAWGRAITWDGRTYSGGLYRSTDFGITWTPASSEPITKMVQDPANPDAFIAIVNDSEVKKSTNNEGATWTTFSTGLPINPTAAAASYANNYRYQGLARAGSSMVIASCTGTFYTLDSGASSWGNVVRQSVNSGDFYFPSGFGSALGHIFVDPTNSSRWIFSDWYSFYQTADSGATWTLSLDGIEPQHVHCITPSSSSSERGLFHLGFSDIGYFRSTDGGKGFWRSSLGSSGNTKSISVCRASPQTVYASGSSSGTWVVNKLFKSTNGGQTWSTLPMTGLPAMRTSPSGTGATCDTITASPADPLWAYVAVSGPIGPGQGGVYRTTDGGNTWSWFGAGLPTGLAFFSDEFWTNTGPQVVFSADARRFATSAELNRVYRYEDASSAWVQLAAQPPSTYLTLLAADATAPGVLYAAGYSGGLWKTANAGDSWVSILPSGAGGLSAIAIAADPEISGHLAVATKDISDFNKVRIWHSRNGGSSWSELTASAGFPGGTPYLAPTMMLGLHADNLVIGTPATGVFWHKLGSR